MFEVRERSELMSCLCLRREIRADELFVFEVREIRADELFVFEEREIRADELFVFEERDQS